MKINVATRVIGGFTVVTLLLMVLGGVTMLSNNSIKDGTTILKTISLPALESTSILSENLSTQQIEALLAYYSTHSSKIPTIEKRLTDLDNAFEKDLARLNNLVSKQNQLTAPLAALTKSYAVYETSATKMLVERESALSLQEKLLKMRSNLENAADDSSSILLDIIDLETSEDQTERSLAASASLVDSTFINIITTIYDLVASTEQSKYDLIIKELDYMVSEASSKLDHIGRQGSGIVSSSILEDLTTESAKVFKLLKGSDSLLALKQQQLDHEFAAAKQLADTQSSAKDVNKKMTVLAKSIDTFAGDISTTALEIIDSAAIKTLLVVLTAIIVAIIVSIAVVKPLTRSLEKVNKALNVLASGDLTHKLDDTGHDEFAELAKNCNRLVDSLRSLIVGIVDRSNQLAAAAEETSAITSQTTIGIQEQKSQVDQVAAATTELSSSAQQVSMSADQALNEIKQADQETQHMRTLAEESKNTILALAEEVAKAGIVINKVHSDSASIGSILDVIRGIADQTNLLALNAAIEAARAGEQGRGFAVVADEVRNLASRTQHSTSEIQQMIEVLQLGTQEAVAVMELGRTQAESCVEKNEQSNLALETISKSVHRAFDSGNHIAQAAQEQNIVSQQVSEKLEHIASISEETSIGADQTAQSSQQVAMLAEELQASVREFKV
ncbi:HAMP domain-containing methyl-accepting chemotaxis protein [Shewanella frigidimarina]|uniref:HAMP domain-containing methyl-accepting chemotaxis protein n=1 Tax=Shewanella frigidimarina TaxID=56812 RepID=UPI003D78C613